MKSLKERIIQSYPDEEFLFADGFDKAILGVDIREHKIVYSKSKCIDILLRDMNSEDAIEYFEYNVEGAYVGEKTPIFIEDTFY
ncbi:MAG TPA: hypothetical protein P5136_00100 [Methanofastidiosum sp.]|nr:hypothetical protein [Methanofastidiosum sp.]